MRFESKFTVVGLKRSKGTLDNGQAYDSTKAFVLVGMDERKGDQRGESVADYNIGDSSEFAKFSEIPLPFEAQAELEIVTNGKTQKTIVHALRPIAATPRQPAKAGA